MFYKERKIIHVGAEKKSFFYINNKFTTNLKIWSCLFKTIFYFVLRNSAWQYLPYL